MHRQSHSVTRTRKSRSFTIACPPPFTKAPVQRTKTFTGCWTCRARGNKCDEARPACLRCLQRGICCEGYGVKLVWEDDRETSGKRVQRRTALTGREAESPVLTPEEVVSALEEVEAALVARAGPFTVFPTSPTLQLELPRDVSNSRQEEHSIQFPSPPNSNHELPTIHEVEDELSPVLDYCDPPMFFEEWQNHNDGDLFMSNDEAEAAEAAMAMVLIKQKVRPQFISYISSASPEERSLLHYWVTFLSGMMLPTQRYDNPFRTIFIPLALSASSSTENSSGSGALLHAIYAVSAFNRARLSPSPERLEALGTKHHRISLQLLRRSLTQLNVLPSQPEAILATIIMMSSIEVMQGNSSTWRTHLTGGKVWLQSMLEQGYTPSDSFSLLYQIFICIDALGNPDISSHTPGVPFDGPTPQLAPFSLYIWGSKYYLGKLFGVTEPLIHAIFKINSLSDPKSQVTAKEIDDLDMLIRRNDPDALVWDLDADYENITRHHACAFFCACLIYFERRLRKTPPKKLQRLVQRSLDHLDTTRTLENEKGLDVCGLFWPEFITVCEAEDGSSLRDRARHLLEKGRLRGIGNIISAEKVVLEVWQRRNEDVEQCDITWQKVMDKMGLDIILT